jgi:hypothetical protein
MKPLLDENILAKVAIVELSLLFVAILLMVIVKVYYTKKNRSTKESQEELKNILLDWIFSGAAAVEKDALPKRLASWQVLLPVLEQFSEKLDDEALEQLKIRLAALYLKPLARIWTCKRSWRKRNTAARIYYLAPERDDQKEILTLIHDKSFLIRSIAAHAGVKTGRPFLIEEVLKLMGREHVRRRHIYRHAIKIGGWNVYEIVIDIYKNSRNAVVDVACLDIFSHEMATDPHKLIERHVESPSPEIRLIIARIVSKYPSRQSLQMLKNYLGDPNPAVRLEAAKGVGILGDASCIEQLKKSLSDNDWQVRAQSALALKSFGEEGVQVLRSLHPDTEPEAYEAGRYALTLP